MKKMMLTRIWIFAVLVAILLPSCTALENANNTQKGAGVGAATGAVLGAIIAGSNNRALGAILGAAVGGVAGGVIGKKMDKQAEAIQTTLPGAEVKRVGEGIQVVLDEASGDGVKFELNSAELTANSKNTLNKLTSVFKQYPDTDILCVGYTDNTGADAYNMQLSQKRAKSVVSYLVAQGIAANRLKSEGKGEEDPKYTNDTDQGRAGNRRVEFAITANQEAVKEAKTQSENQ